MKPAGAGVAGFSLTVFTMAGLVGCAPFDPGTIPTSPPPAITESPRPRLKPGPTPEPTAPDVARGPGTPLEPVDAYALCKAQTTLYFPGDFALLSWAPFEEATWVERPDGDIGIYLEVVDRNRVPGETDSAITCTLGGTIGAVEWSGFGNLLRLPADEIDEMLRSTPEL